MNENIRSVLLFFSIPIQTYSDNHGFKKICPKVNLKKHVQELKHEKPEEA